ncbi:PAS domain-containing sensor histidine kinase [Microcoleus vaginatus PCC 9802]|uniref:PAS domain-containing sensor histidine kinase n=1 Tax=Microcoleus vaginatus TaxID=119532 RepID=UPI00020D2217|nr:multi-sensor signal transduction histidine kinase [Microcoleus vaginatus FGP-2]UNU17760.1 PAS domain-containing sensor histidine kinase [Microcoleus vaginatus PCC 9802]
MSYLGNAKSVQGLTVYEVWRDRFLRDRLRPAVGIAIFFAFTITVYFLGERFFVAQEFKSVYLYTSAAVELGLLTCFVLQKTSFGQRYPGLLFLGFSWSLTVVVQLGLAVAQAGELPIFTWSLAFLIQATLMPVRWRLHLISQLGVLCCHVGINLALNLSFAKYTPFKLTGFYLYLFWFCLICDLSVYWYECLQRKEFSTRRELESAYQQLEVAEAKYRSIFENAGEGIFQSTPDGRYITANPALARIYGCDSPEEVTAKFTDIERQLYVDPHRRNEFLRSIEESGTVSDFESKIYRSDGSIVWISEKARAVRDSSGAVLYYEGLIEDITQRKQAQESLRLFIHALSHDLRNPVAGMLMVLKNWQTKPGDSIAIPRSFLERMIQGSEQQLRLINSLLEVHAGELRGLVLHCDAVDLRAVVEAAATDLEPLMNEGKATFKNLVPDNLPAVNADKTQLWRVFSNLFANALKHNLPGLNLTVSAQVIKAGKLIINQSTAKQDIHKLPITNPQSPITNPQSPIPNPGSRMIYCTVEDDGAGILPEQCEHLFDLYLRGDKSRHSVGLGLGLYLCRQIIGAHGGQIGVISTPGAGASFWFTLPLAENFR